MSNGRAQLLVIVKSKNPTVSTPILLQRMQKLLPTLEHEFSSKSVKEVSMKREGTLPVGVEGALVALTLTFGKKVAEVAAKTLTTEVLAWIRKRLSGAAITKSRQVGARKGTIRTQQRVTRPRAKKKDSSR